MKTKAYDMTTLKLNILQEHAIEILRSLEKMRAVEIVNESPKEPPSEPVQKWGGIISDPSDELINYADKVRGEWENRI